MSSRNALRHGLSARKHLLAGESWEEYLGLHEEIAAILKPKGALEMELAQQIVSVLWRLRRIPAFEAALMAHLRDRNGSELVLSNLDADTWQLALAVGAFLREDFSGKLSRYQASLQRQFSALLQALYQLQARRREEGEGQVFAPAIARAPEISRG